MWNQTSYARPINRLLGAALFGGLLALAGCGPEDTDGTPDSGPSDGMTVDGSADDGGTDATDTGRDTGDGPVDTGADTDDGGMDADGGEMTGSSVPDSWTVCRSTADCPIQGTTCLKQVSYNRPDHTGETSATIADLYDRVGDGQGICSQPCSDDPTVCDGIKWADASGEQVTARCHLLESGASPYQLAGMADFTDAMKKGAAFAAACLPPIAESDERSGKVCQSCDQQSACGSETACVNMKTETMRREADETGASICAARCQQTADCAVGFECVPVGDGSMEGEMTGDAGMGDAGDAGSADTGIADSGASEGGMPDVGTVDAGTIDAGTSDGPGYCLPVSRTCDDCRDRDADDRGTGHCGPASDRQTEVDCNDVNAEAYYNSEEMDHPWPTYCGVEDYNCDGVPDDQQLIGNQQYAEEHCTACGDTCSGMASGGAVYQCVTDMEASSGYACVPDCPQGQSADCDGDPTNGCEITLSGAKQNADQAKYLFYADADGDGFGADSTAQVFCSQADAKRKTGNDLVAKGGDCDDSADKTYPGATEICDGVDNACEGGGASNIDEGCDDDGDDYCDADMGYEKSAANVTCSKGKGDCDDGSATTHPGAAPDDSTTECMRDADGDGYGSVNAPSGGSAGTDCNDSRSTTYPGAAPKDSTTACMKDGDGDGYGSKTPPPNRPVQVGSDCDDTRKAIKPSATETCNGFDDDCDGTVDEEAGGNVNMGKSIGDKCTPMNRQGQCATGYTLSCEASQSNNDPNNLSALSCTNPNPKTPTTEEPGFDAVDDSCDGLDRYAGTNGRAYHAIFVDAAKSSSNRGRSPSSATPDLNRAMNDADSASWCTGKRVDGQDIPCDIYVAQRTVSIEGRQLPEGHHIYGGFDSQSWTQSSWLPGGASRSSKTTVNVQPPSGQDSATGFYGYSISETTVLSGLKVQAADVTEPNADSVGFWCEYCSGLWLDNVSFYGGKAGDGEDGRPAPYASQTFEASGYQRSCLDDAPSGYLNQLRSRFYSFSTVEGQGAGTGSNRLEGYDFKKADGGSYRSDGDNGGYLLNTGNGATQGGGMSTPSGDLSFSYGKAGSGTYNDGGGGGGAWEANFGTLANGTPGGSGGCPGLGGRPGKAGGYSIGLILLRTGPIHLNKVQGQGKQAGAGGDGGVGGKGAPGMSGATNTLGQSAGDGGHGAGGDGGGGGAGGHSIGCLLSEQTVASGNFDRTANCFSGTAGQGGKGGAGGSSPGTDGRKGGDGVEGLSCGYYEAGSRWSGSVTFGSSSCN